MKTLAKNGNYTLVHFPQAVNQYAVYLTSPALPSGDLKLDTMVARSSVLSKKLKSFFTSVQIQDAVAKIHAIKYASKKFKA